MPIGVVLLNVCAGAALATRSPIRPTTADMKRECVSIVRDLQDTAARSRRCVHLFKRIAGRIALTQSRDARRIE
jgi:hypothetical protein